MTKLIYIFISLFLLLPGAVFAQTAEEMLLSMPDSIVPYLSADNRAELVKNHKTSISAFDGIVSIDTLASKYVRLNLSKSSKDEILMLPYGESSICCLVKTVYGPAAESTVEFFDNQWKRIPNSFLPELSVSDFIEKPDTMSEDNFRTLKLLLSPAFISVTVVPEDNKLVFSVCAPLVDKKTGMSLKTITRQIVFSWSDNRFQYSKPAFKA